MISGAIGFYFKLLVPHATRIDMYMSFDLRLCVRARDTWFKLECVLLKTESDSSYVKA